MSKIAILGLHLNFGGVEQSIINQANMLCNDYEVELIITYKLNEKPAFKVNPKVKITYLTEYKPNKEEFTSYLHNHKFIKAFKEGLKSLKILHAKQKSMQKYLKNTDADIIISSRIEITKILNKLNLNKVTIAEEHTYHNNKKYIHKLQKACSNINYLLPVSKELTNLYKPFLPNTKCLYMPNALDYYPKKGSPLNNKNIISIGRLSPEKGYLDLIEVFKLIHEMDNEIHLDIVGDGEDYELIKAKIKEYNLTNYVTLHGFQNKEYIHKLLSKSSLYLMCSYEESFGLVLVEAESFGIPSLAFSSAKGATEIITNNKNGYLIENRDFKAMANLAVKLLKNPSKLQTLGAYSSIEAQKYSFENVKQKWLEFLKEEVK